MRIGCDQVVTICGERQAWQDCIEKTIDHIKAHHHGYFKKTREGKKLRLAKLIMFGAKCVFEEEGDDQRKLEEIVQTVNDKGICVMAIIA